VAARPGGVRALAAQRPDPPGRGGPGGVGGGGLRRAVNRLCVNKARIDWADAAARRGHLGELVGLARAVLAATAGDEELAEARDLLARVVDQDIDETPADGGGPAIRQGVAPDRVCSVVDPEMRHGRKSSSRRVDGYKAHVLTDHGTELVLGVTVTPANDPDGPEAAGLVAQADAGVPVREVLGDTAYGDGDTREAVEAAGATVTAKDAAPGHHWSLHQERLRDRPRGPVGDLPGRHTTTTTGIGQDHKGRRVTVLKFADDLCRDCPLRAACTIAAHGRWVTLNFHEARLQAARG
jgi:Transposase DDE domain